jgi:hypothetical protein
LRWRRQVSYVVLASALFVVAAAGSAAAHISEFCESDLVVRDYLSPLKRYPGAAGFSDSGKLTAGPAVLRVFPPRDVLVLTGEGHFESQGALNHDLSVGLRARRLDWTVQSTLTRIGRIRADERVVRSKRQFIAKVAGFAHRNFGFGATAKSGIYRLDVTFRNSAGKSLERREEYFRAVLPRPDVRLAASPASVHPGSTGYLRVENFGTIDSTYFDDYRIVSASEPSRDLPLEPQVGANYRPLVKAGRAGRCFEFRIPKETPPGEYRIGIRINNRLLVSPRMIWASLSVA